jgi:hydroxyacylglutathione hydrolase
MRTVVVPNRTDNYSYLLIDDKTRNAAALDTFDVLKIKAAAEEIGVKIVANLTTHHHHDHSGGNVKFAATYPGVPIYGGSHNIPKLTNLVKDQDEFTIGDLQVRCLATPCHTQDSICYFVTDTTDKNTPTAVFTGDTLFIAGCGRFFEGDGAQMHTALSYLGTLPNDTVVYVGHEYTNANVAFAKSIDPHNDAITRLAEIAKKNEITTGLTTIGDEKEWNVFMRLGSDAVRKATGASADSDISKGAIMDKLRDQKNNYKG